MGAFAVESSKYAKIKKTFVVENGKYARLKKAYVVEGGKYVKLWSGSEFKLVVSPYKKTDDTGSYPMLFSDDGTEWEASASNTVYQLTSIINVDGVLYGLNENRTSQDGALVRKYTWYLYKSTDNGATWTSVASQEGGGGNYILRYLNGKFFIIGSHHSSGSSYKNYWYSSDLGATWTSGKYSVNDGDNTALHTTNSYPLDLRYGKVNGTSKEAYYLLVADSSNAFTRVYSSTSHTLSFTFVTTATSSYCDSGAMSIKNGVMCMVLGTKSGTTYCRKYANGSNTSVKTFSNNPLGTVASNSECIVATYGASSFKYDGTTFTQGGSTTSGHFNGNSTFASAFVNGTRVFAFKAGSSVGTSTLDYIMYSDNCGETWTVLNVPGLNGLCYAMCSITDSYY